MAVCCRRRKTLDLPKDIVQYAGILRCADTMQILRGDRYADDDRTLGGINPAGTGWFIIAGGQNNRVKTGDEYGQDICFACDFIGRFLGCPQRPQQHIRFVGGDDACSFSVGEDPLQKPEVPALSDIAGIGQIHNVVADKSHRISPPFAPAAR